MLLGSALLVLLSITSCQKEVSAPYNGSQNASFRENGYTWAGWDIKNPIPKFDTLEQNIYIGDRDWNNAGNQLQGKELESSGPKTVYAVQPFIQGSFYNIKSDLERRGWKIAPLSYLLALAKEYGFFEGSQVWNIYCLNIPVKAVFNGGNPEEFAAQAWGNYYRQENNRLYRMGMNFVQFSNNYGGLRVLCYR